MQRRMTPILVTGSSGAKRLEKARELAAKFLGVKEAKMVSHPDFLELSPAPSITIEQARGIIRMLSRKPYQGKGVAVIVDQAHLATVEAQNALLKTLEEPPGFALLVLTAPNKDLLLATVVSRCVEVPLKPQKGVEVQGAVGKETDKLLDFLLKKAGKERLARLDELCLTRPESQALLERLIEAAQRRLVKAGAGEQSELARFIRAANSCRAAVQANVNIRLAIADFLLTSYEG